MKVNKVGKSQYGCYFSLEDGSTKSINEQVYKFTKGKEPFEAEITETSKTDRGEVITKVKLDKNSFQKTETRPDDRPKVDLGNRFVDAVNLYEVVLTNAEKEQKAEMLKNPAQIVNDLAKSLFEGFNEILSPKE